MTLSEESHSHNLVGCGQHEYKESSDAVAASLDDSTVYTCGLDLMAYLLPANVGHVFSLDG